MQPATGLRRDITLTALVLYGLGTTIGAGIYALIGEIAGAAGTKAPLAFLLAAFLAASTGLGFAELTGRLPVAAGEAVFVRHAFGLPILSRAIGVAVVVAGVVAGAAITDAFAGYLADVTDVPRPVAIVGLTAMLGAFAIAGVKASVWVAGAFTIVEVAGLCIVIFYARDVLGQIPALANGLFAPPTEWDGMLGIFSGAFIAFFAFLGFDDMDSIAEETQDASVSLPRAIIWTLSITAVLYVVIAVVAVASMSPELLAQSEAPLADITRVAGGPGRLLALIGTLAMVNGALVQIVMVPRVLYGMANLGDAPRWFGRVEERTGTPASGTLAAMIVIVLFAWFLDLGQLARITSALTIGVFAAVNVSLIRIKRRDGPPVGFEVALWVPVVGLIVSVAMFIAEVARLLGS